jgi:hypothetical protein
MERRILEWKWSNGEKADRSPRPTKHYENERVVEESKEFQENSVVDHCLYAGEEIYGGNQQQNLFNEFQRQPNKREDTYNRMAEREMVGQRGMNPFMQNNNGGYIDDLMVQENFLKPISTSMERERE